MKNLTLTISSMLIVFHIGYWGVVIGSDYADKTFKEATSSTVRWLVYEDFPKRDGSIGEGSINVFNYLSAKKKAFQIRNDALSTGLFYVLECVEVELRNACPEISRNVERHELTVFKPSSASGLTERFVREAFLSTERSFHGIRPYNRFQTFEDKWVIGLASK